MGKVLGKGDLLAYLVSMSLRIAEIFRVLKPTGSFYLHCDPTSSHYLKLVLDSIFCAKGGDFKNEIVWEKTRVPKAQSNQFAKQQDIFFFYVKSDNYCFNVHYNLPNETYIKKYFSQTEENTGRKYQLVSFLQDGSGQPRSFGERSLTPPPGKHWIWSQDRINDAMQKGLLVFTHPDKPRLKKYLDEQLGKNLGTIWNDIPPINSQAKERLGYPTQKPEDLLERIISTSSNKGDTILDAYCGCGTTLSVAEKLLRNWVGIDITYQSISLMLKRLEDSFGKNILDNIELTGVPKDQASAIALAHKKDDKTRKEFEKWAVLTYSNNRAMINEKKGSDGGIDGIAYMVDRDTNDDSSLRQVLFSVKSDKTPHVTYIRDFHGTIEREGAAIGYFITLFPPTKEMVNECKKIGVYHNSLMGKDYPKIEIITVEEILKGSRITIPTSHSVAVVKSAQLKESTSQVKLEL